MKRKPRRVDITGKTFGKWKVLGFSHNNENQIPYWNCVCECGELRTVRGSHLKNGKSVSCGCARKDAITTHGMTGTRTFKSWEGMKQRCTNPNAPDYDRYGGRGIKVCERWLASFDAFLSEMGERPEGMTLDRIDNEGDYTPENCRWSYIDDQLYNRRNTVRVHNNGSFYTVKELSDISGLSKKMIRQRISAGWDFDKIVATPKRRYINDLSYH